MVECMCTTMYFERKYLQIYYCPILLILCLPMLILDINACFTSITSCHILIYFDTIPSTILNPMIREDMMRLSTIWDEKIKYQLKYYRSTFSIVFPSVNWQTDTSPNGLVCLNAKVWQPLKSYFRKGRRNTSGPPPIKAIPHCW